MAAGGLPEQEAAGTVSEQLSDGLIRYNGLAQPQTSLTPLTPAPK